MSLETIASQLDWSNEQISSAQIASIYNLPQIVKSIAKSSCDKNTDQNSVYLLLMEQQLLRVIAQEIGPTCYVFGNQFEIPSSFDGKFQLCLENERDEDPIKSYKFIADVAAASIKKFYLWENISVTLPNNNRSGSFSTIDLLEGEEFTVKHLNHTDTAQRSKPASHKISPYLSVAGSNHQFLEVHCTRLDHNLRLPYTLKASFASNPPRLLSYSLKQERDALFSIGDFLQFGNFPLTVVLKSFGDSQTLSNKKSHVYCGMRIKLIGLEIHSVYLAADMSSHIVEFFSDALFEIPSILRNYEIELNEESSCRIDEYRNHIRNSISDLKLVGDLSIVKEYCKSTRDHTNLHNGSISRTSINPLACLRHLNMTLFCVDDEKLNAFQRLLCNNDHSSSKVEGQGSEHANSLTSTIASAESEDDEESMWGEIKLPSPPPIPNVGDRNQAPQEITARETDPPEVAEPSFELEESMDNFYPNNVIQPDSFSLVEYPRNNSKSPSSSSTCIKPESNAVTMVKETYTSTHASSNPDQTVPKQLYESRYINRRREAEHERTSSYDRVILHPDHNIQIYPSSEQEVHANPANCNIFIRGRSRSRINVHLHPSPNFRHDPSENFQSSSAHETRNSSSTTNTRRALSGNTRHENNSPDQSETKPKQLYSHVNSTDPGASISNQGRRDPTTNSTFTRLTSEWLPSVDVSSMNVTELANSLRYIGINEEISEFFYRERIDGNLLLKLPDEILKQDCHLNPLQVFKLKAFIDGWRPKLF